MATPPASRRASLLANHMTPPTSWRATATPAVAHWPRHPGARQPRRQQESSTPRTSSPAASSPTSAAEPEHPRRRHHRRRAFITAEPPRRRDRTPKARLTLLSSLHRPVHQGGATALRPRPSAGHRAVSSSSQCDIARASTVFDEAATAVAMSSPCCTSSHHQPSPHRLATAAPRPAPPSALRRHQR